MSFFGILRRGMLCAAGATDGRLISHANNARGECRFFEGKCSRFGKQENAVFTFGMIYDIIKIQTADEGGQYDKLDGN